jgi:hypothetical protein
VFLLGKSVSGYKTVQSSIEFLSFSLVYCFLSLIKHQITRMPPSFSSVTFVQQLREWPRWKNSILHDISSSKIVELDCLLAVSSADTVIATRRSEYGPIGIVHDNCWWRTPSLFPTNNSSHLSLLHKREKFLSMVCEWNDNVQFFVSYFLWEVKSITKNRCTFLYCFSLYTL